MRDLALGPTLPDELGSLFLALAGSGARTALNRLVARLDSLIDAPIAGLVLYGSFAHRRTGPPGDIDALILAGSPLRGGLWGVSGEIALDVHVEPFDDTLADDPGRWLHLSDGWVVHDPSGRVGPWVDRIRATEALPPDPPPASASLRDRVWARRTLARVRRHATDDPTRALLHRAALIAALPELHARARDEHGTSMSDWLRRVRETEPALARLIEQLGDPQQADTALEAALDLIDPPIGISSG